jgi:hypothetical protein
VEAFHESIPYLRRFTVATRDCNDLYVAQFLQRALHLGHLDSLLIPRVGFRSFETGFISFRQRDEAAPMEFKKCLTAADLFQFAIGRAPLQPLAYAQ